MHWHVRLNAYAPLPLHLSAGNSSLTTYDWQARAGKSVRDYVITAHRDWLR